MTRSPLLLLPLLVACAGKTPGDDTGDTSAANTCASGEHWTGGNEESPRMNPGESCIGCHSRGEGPDFTLAGTVMGDWDDEDDCFGVEGVIVRVTGSDGVVTELTSNDAGNFYTRDHIATPFTVELESDAGTRAMSAEQTDGDCASCHTASGTGGAPGRVVAP